MRQLLHRHGLTFQRTKTWKESADPDRDAKLVRIEQVTNTFPDRVFVRPVDHPPARVGHWPATRNRLPANYHKLYGVRQLHGCYSVGDERLWVSCAGQFAANTLAAPKSIRAACPDGAPIYVVADNLSAHKGLQIRAWAARNKVKLCFTPTYASWANPIEAQFGPLRTFVGAGSNRPNHTVVTHRLQAYLRWRNGNTRHPDVLAAQRDERARICSQRQRRWEPDHRKGSGLTNTTNVCGQSSRQGLRLAFSACTWRISTKVG